MDRMKDKGAWPLETLTGGILEVAFAVANELGHGFGESVYRKALAIALEERGYRVEQERGFSVLFHGQVVGDFRADLIVEGSVLLEIKALKALLPEHQAQTINYLKASGIPVGLLINFGTPRIEYRRCHAPT